jgi:U3 small nucleolar RNA-associated protein 18
MAKHPKKKQRLATSASSAIQKLSHTSGKYLKASQRRKQKPSIQPLGSEATLARLLDEESKDDEERRLESMLFGVPYVPSGGKRGPSTKRIAEGGLVFAFDEDEDEPDEEDESGGRPMMGLLDSDVCIPCFV